MLALALSQLVPCFTFELSPQIWQRLQLVPLPYHPLSRLQVHFIVSAALPAGHHVEFVANWWQTLHRKQAGVVLETEIPVP